MFHSFLSKDVSQNNSGHPRSIFGGQHRKEELGSGMSSAKAKIEKPGSKRYEKRTFCVLAMSGSISKRSAFYRLQTDHLLLRHDSLFSLALKSRRIASEGVAAQRLFHFIQAGKHFGVQMIHFLVKMCDFQFGF